MLLLLLSVSCLTLHLWSQDVALFSRIDAPSGVAAAPGKLLVTEYCGDRRHILNVDEQGNPSIFATLPPTGGGCSEIYLAISPGFGGFQPNYVYVSYGQTILEVTPDGIGVKTFATIPSLQNTHSGLTFDHVGSFGYGLLVTGYNGEIWQLDASGNTSLLALAPKHIEGPAVAPETFGRFGRQLLVGAEDANAVLAISHAGDVSYVGAWFSAENVNFIPDKVCEFGESGGAYFASVFPALNGDQGLIKLPASAFAGLEGSALVAGEKDSGIGLFTPKWNTIATSTFLNNVGTHEGAAMVDCSVPLEVQIKIVNKHRDNQDDDGDHIKLAILSTRSFDAPSRIVPDTLTFGLTGNEHSFDNCKKRVRDVNGDGFNDLVCTFDSDDAGELQLGAPVNLKGWTKDGLRISGSAVLQVSSARGHNQYHRHRHKKDDSEL